ncbi:MAG: hypothetical protein GIW95_09720 [Candidatus Eremiobacteraeota bacterium]|nr:hypothetical protein [Candidatus Eremiobacteraeota bacterium]
MRYRELLPAAYGVSFPLFPENRAGGSFLITDYERHSQAWTMHGDVLMEVYRRAERATQDPSRVLDVVFEESQKLARPHQVEVVLASAEAEVDWLPLDALQTAREELLGLVERLRDLAERARAHTWRDRFAASSELLAASMRDDPHGEPDDRNALDLFEAARLAWCFGAMGSFADVADLGNGRVREWINLSFALSPAMQKLKTAAAEATARRALRASRA